MTDEPTDAMGRINLPPPDDDALRSAANDVLAGADLVTMDGGGRLFRSSFPNGGVLFAPFGEPCGEPIESAAAAVKHAVMDAAGRVRAAAADIERERFTDPKKNLMIRT